MFFPTDCRKPFLDARRMPWFKVEQPIYKHRRGGFVIARKWTYWKDHASSINFNIKILLQPKHARSVRVMAKFTNLPLPIILFMG